MSKSMRRAGLAITGFISLTILLHIGSMNTSGLRLYFLNIGQGDSSLIKLPRHKTILIDGGPDNLVIRRLGDFLPFYQRKIDLVILSHPHDDHILGLIELVRRFQVGTLIYMWQEDAPPFLEMLIAEAKKRQVNVIELKTSVIYEFGADCHLKITNPESLQIKEDDNNSLVARLKCLGFSALWTGDNSAEVENALIQASGDWASQVLKAGHHGSKTANSREFLEIVSPSVFVVSVGEKNRFGHPSPEVMELLAGMKIPVKRTDKDGTVVIDGLVEKNLN